jgi:DNA polymerase I-like protein with 3'-5' exonuclease and polymerase domains
LLKNIVNEEVFSDAAASLKTYYYCGGVFNCSQCSSIINQAKKLPKQEFINFYPGYITPDYDSGVVFLINGYPDKHFKFMTKESSLEYKQQISSIGLTEYALIPTIKCGLDALEKKDTASIRENCFEVSRLMLKERLKPKVIVVDDVVTLNKLTGLKFFIIGKIINKVLWSPEFNCHIVVAPPISKIIDDAVEMQKIQAEFNKRRSAYRNTPVNPDEKPPLVYETVKYLQFQKTFKIVKSLLDKTYPDTRQYIPKTVYKRLHVGMEEDLVYKVFDYLKKIRKLGVDIETDGLSVFHHEITSLAIAFKPGYAYVMNREFIDKYRDKLQELFSSELITKIFANGHFDLSFLVKYGFSFAGKLTDIQALNYLFENGYNYEYYVIGKDRQAKQVSKGYNTLKFMAWQYTDMGGYEKGIKELGGVLSAQTQRKKKEEPLGLFDELIKENLRVENTKITVDDCYPVDELTEFEKYNCMDADATLRIELVQREIIPEGLQKLNDTILCPLIFEVLVHQYLDGIKIGREYIADLHQRYTESSKKHADNFYAALKTELKQLYGGVKHSELAACFTEKGKIIDINKWGSQEEYDTVVETLPFNINAPLQLLKIYKLLGYIEPNAESVDSDVLEHLSNVKKIQSATSKKLFQPDNKLLSTYIIPIQRKMHDDDMLHAQIGALHTLTGRLNSEDPNLQNIPADSLIRNIFEARPGYSLLDFDYSQGELRVVGDTAEEKSFIDAYIANKDLHYEMARLMYSLPFDSRQESSKLENIMGVVKYLHEKNKISHNFSFEEDFWDAGYQEYKSTKTTSVKEILDAVKIMKVWDGYRANAKTINFTLLYGVSKFGLAKKLFPDFLYVEKPKKEAYLEEAQESIDLWFSKVPNIERWLAENLAFAKKHGYVISRLGRIRQLPFVRSNYPKFQSSSSREAGNTPIQSELSDICAHAAVLLRREFNKNPKEDCRIVNLVHDNILSEVPDDRVPYYMELKKDIMEKRVNILKHIPLVVDSKVTKKWEK